MTTRTVMKTVMGAGMKMNMMNMTLQTSRARVGSRLEGLENGGGASELTTRVTGAVENIVLIVTSFNIHDFGGGGIWGKYLS